MRRLKEFATRWWSRPSPTSSTTTAPPHSLRHRAFLNLEVVEDRLAPATLVGSLDGIDPQSQVVSGWAAYLPLSSQSITVLLKIDGQPVRSAVANFSRPDVETALSIRGSYGYNVPIPASFLDGRSHTATIDAVNPTGGPNQQIGSTTFIDRPTRGALDGITAGGVVYGWAYDPDFPAQSVVVHLYVDGVLVTTGLANQPRPDVNQALGIVGNHGYAITIPHAYLDGRTHSFTAYGIDRADLALQPGAQVNTKLGSRSFAFGNSTIQGATSQGGPIQIQTSAAFAGAITSLTWNGQQFINATDHGRELQSAITTDAGVGGGNKGEGFNPTEAGSAADGAGATSSSRLLALSAQENQLTATTQMAFWDAPGQPGAYNTSVLSDFLLAKNLTIGFQGLSNVIQYQTTFTVPPNSNTRLAQFETLTGYMPPGFSNFMVYDPASRTVRALQPSNANPEQPLPLVFATTDGQHAMAIVTQRNATIGGSGQVGYGRWNFALPNGYGQSIPVVKWNTVFRLNDQPVAGTYTFVNYVVVGNLSTVVSSLRALQTMVPLVAPPSPVSQTLSTISVSSVNIPTGGSVKVTLQAKDANGNNESRGGLAVAFGLAQEVGRGAFGPVIDNQNGTYTTTLTAITGGGNTITAAINGQAVGGTNGGVAVQIQLSPAELIAVGESYVRSARVSDGIYAFLLAVQASPNNVLALTDLGEAYISIGDHVNGNYALLRAAQSAPANVRVLLALGNSYMRTGNSQDGIYSFLLAVQADPHNVTALTDLGRAYISIGDYVNGNYFLRQRVSS